MNRLINLNMHAVPGHSGMSAGYATEDEARAAAYDYAQLLLGNDDARRRAEVELSTCCFACGGAGRWKASSMRGSRAWPCAVCKGAGEFPLAQYTITRE